MEATFISTVVLLFLVMDPFGGIPLFVTALRNVEEGRKIRVVLRECLIAFVLLLGCLIGGQHILNVLQLSQTSLGIAGGIVLFIIALRIIFPTTDGVFGDIPGGEPFIFPLAIPLIAGPSALATVLLLASRYPERLLEWVAALSLAVGLSALILSLGNKVLRLLGERGLLAAERLVGLVLTAMAVEMFLNGVKEFLRAL
jgi:small neutral amino acid transporter SnatA (MarC family)